MKNLLPIALLLSFALVFNSCQPDESLTIKSLDQILNGEDYAVNNGMLVVKDREVLTRLVNEFNQKSNDELDSWEKSIGHKSIQRVFNEVDLEENKFLEGFVKEFGEDAPLTRQEIGFTTKAQGLLDKGSLVIDDEGMLAMNITSPQYSRLVNESGLIRVGDFITQYGKDYVKTILSADDRQIASLGETTTSNSQIVVSQVKHDVVKTNVSGKTDGLLSSCERYADKYRIIGYEDFNTYSEGGFPCPPLLNDYSIRIRSLKKILGTWQNYNTNFNAATTQWTAYHRNCDGSVVRNVYGQGNNGDWTCPFGNTCTITMISRYDTGECTNTSPNCSGQIGYVAFTDRRHTVRSYNDNSCQLGAW